MRSEVTDEFKKRFNELPDEVKQLARKAYRLWKSNPAHPSLRFKEIQAQDSIWSIRIGLGWRALGLRRNDVITWFWIGFHADYDKLIRTL